MSGAAVMGRVYLHSAKPHPSSLGVVPVAPGARCLAAERFHAELLVVVDALRGRPLRGGGRGLAHVLGQVGGLDDSAVTE
mgnify:CR=1 FL=1